MWKTILDKLHKTFIVNWLTGIPGGLAFACESAAIADLLPAEWHAKQQAICLLLLTFGVIGSKSQNVSNAKEPVAPQIVSTVNEAKPNTADE